MQNQVQQDIENIEVEIETAKKSIETHEALKRLIANPDFDALITKGYFRDEAERVVGARADVSMKMNEVGMVMLEEQMIGIGALRQYFLKIQKEGYRMKEAMEELTSTQTELLTEQVGELQ